MVDANEIGPQDRAIVEEMSARKVKKILVLNKIGYRARGSRWLMAAIQSFAEAGYDDDRAHQRAHGQGRGRAEKADRFAICRKGRNIFRMTR